jgi:hypothetical protein
MYSVFARIIHNKAACEVAGERLQVTTPVAQWAFAVEFLPQGGAVPPGSDIKLKLRVRVSEGAIGIGLLNPQGRSGLAEAVPPARLAVCLYDIKL